MGWKEKRHEKTKNAKNNYVSVISRPNKLLWGPKRQHTFFFNDAIRRFTWCVVFLFGFLDGNFLELRGELAPGEWRTPRGRWHSLSERLCQVWINKIHDVFECILGLYSRINIVVLVGKVHSESVPVFIIIRTLNDSIVFFVFTLSIYVVCLQSCMSKDIICLICESRTHGSRCCMYLSTWEFISTSKNSFRCLRCPPFPWQRNPVDLPTNLLEKHNPCQKYIHLCCHTVITCKTKQRLGLVDIVVTCPPMDGI